LCICVCVFVYVCTCSTEWPAGRVLLEWAVGAIPPTGAKVLELGAGVGVMALGLSLACASAQAHSALGPPTVIVATDVCETSLQNLRANAAANQIAVCAVDSPNAGGQYGSLAVGVWDAAGGQASVRRLSLDFGIDPRTLTHVVGGDVMYHGFDGATDVANEGLASTLAALLAVNPNLNITLLLVDRFSGGTVAAVSQV